MGRKRRKMTTSLADAVCNNGLASGYAEVRRFIASQAITVNGEVATAWNQLVHCGDIIKLGKYRTCVVR